MTAWRTTSLPAITAAAGVAALAACGGGASPRTTVPAAAPGGTSLQSSSNATGSLRLFVANTNADSITVYHETDSGNVAPTLTLSGPHTNLHTPSGVAVDSAGRIGVSDVDSLGVVRAAVYAPGASGDATPVRSISCGGMTVALSAAFDLQGQLYVTSGDDGDDISVLGTSANGFVQNNRIIAGNATGLHQPFGIVVARSGAIYVVNGSGASVETFASGAAGNVRPRTFIFGSRTGIVAPAGIAVDASGTMYVTDSRNNSVLVFANGASGNVAPLRSIAGAKTGLNMPIGIAVSPTTGAIFVANAAPSTVTVYPGGASGNQSPMRTISGSNTGLLVPYHITLAP